MILKNALVYRAVRGTGPGGQHRNTTFSDIEVSLTPEAAAGLGVPVLKAKACGRSQAANKKAARKILLARIYAALAKKKDRYGAGHERVRNYHEPDNRVTDDHGNQWSYRQTVGKGDISDCIEARARAMITENGNV